VEQEIIKRLKKWRHELKNRSTKVFRPEEVDKTREAAHRILAESGEFQRLILDLK
jgi:hypothetical protein